MKNFVVRSFSEQTYFDFFAYDVTLAEAARYDVVHKK